MQHRLLARFVFVVALLSASTAAVADPPAGDDPQISRSRGEAGGAVVLWTRVIPRTDDPAIAALAGEVQAKLAAAVARALPGRAIDRRPSPERVCPRAGCLGTAAGALLLHRDGGCAVVLLVSAPGQSVSNLLEWAGGVTLASKTVPFREPPEGVVRVKDFVRCTTVPGLLETQAPAVDEALAAAAK